MNRDLLDLMKYRNKHKIYMKKYLKGGAFPLYVVMSRLSVSDIKTDDTKEKIALKKLVDDAIRLKRYYYEYFDKYGNKRTDGKHIASGLSREEIKRIDVRNIDINFYESTLIIDELYALQDLLRGYDIKTVQSSISYYNNNCSFSLPYFQLPFIEFVGGKKEIPVLKMIVDHDLLKNYYATSFSDDVFPNTVRVTIMRPYLNESGRLIQEFDDKQFWKDVIQAVKNVVDKIANDSELKKTLREFKENVNDSELDKSKKWYIFDPDGFIVEITDKTKMNPYFPNIPLSTLNVRYEPNIELFKRKLVK